MTAETATMHVSGIAAGVASADADADHPDSGPHAGENGTFSPGSEAPPVANGDAPSGHSIINMSAPETDPEDAGASKADNKGEAAGGVQIPELWKKR